MHLLDSTEDGVVCLAVDDAGRTYKTRWRKYLNFYMTIIIPDIVFVLIFGNFRMSSIKIGDIREIWPSLLLLINF